MNNPIIFETDFHTVYHEASFFIPGYLIIFPKNIRVTNWQDFSKESLMNLGSLMALCHSCVKNVIKAERVYSAQFGEIERNIHIHIFPRDKNTTEKYLSANNLDLNSPIAGPALMNWVFDNKSLFKGSRAEITETITKLTSEFEKLSLIA